MCSTDPPTLDDPQTLMARPYRSKTRCRLTPGFSMDHPRYRFRAFQSSSRYLSNASITLRSSSGCMMLSLFLTNHSACAMPCDLPLFGLWRKSHTTHLSIFLDDFLLFFGPIGLKSHTYFRFPRFNCLDSSPILWIHPRPGRL